MARLPGEMWLIQQIGGNVILFEEGSEREIVRIPLFVREPGNTDENAPLVPNDNGFARAQRIIYDSELLTPEDKCFAHFWCGYFWRGVGDAPEPGRRYATTTEGETMAKPAGESDRTLELEGSARLWAEGGKPRLSIRDPEFSTVIDLHSDAAEDAMALLKQHGRTTD